ncbi:hypothetical protein KEF29_31470 [Streptomyces tuirus]|uniref:Uncharacterized protein n=1 Tax=Streptomyces tuirus TaxID=68278 RepID=A0A941FGJ3_9ACTN|nr:hypothetical protein [Streptomyces tuirus]
MQAREFDDRRISKTDDRPSYFVEQWSWEVVDDGRRIRDLTCATYTLSDCDVLEALEWAESRRSEPGSFVLHAATWTNQGFLETLWLTGSPPEQGSSGSAREHRGDR